jgi:hypothetical protein
MNQQTRLQILTMMFIAIFLTTMVSLKVSLTLYVQTFQIDHRVIAGVDTNVVSTNNDHTKMLVDIISVGSITQIPLQDAQHPIDHRVIAGVDTNVVSTNDDHPKKMVDIISVGSITQIPLQDAQQRTFGSHHAVRNLYRITQMNDTDRECFTNLTVDQVAEIVRFCQNKSKTGESFLASSMRTKVSYKKKKTGWTCAQKRPIDGLYAVLKKYRDDGVEIPHYLLVIDDDTYIDMDALTNILYKDFHYNTPQLVAGCEIFGWIGAGMNFPMAGLVLFFLTHRSNVYFILLTAAARRMPPMVWQKTHFLVMLVRVYNKILWEKKNSSLMG